MTVTDDGDPGPSVGAPAVTSAGGERVIDRSLVEGPRSTIIDFFFLASEAPTSGGGSSPARRVE
jgi:hypothetical protein